MDRILNNPYLEEYWKKRQDKYGTAPIPDKHNLPRIRLLYSLPNKLQPAESPTTAKCDRCNRDNLPTRRGHCQALLYEDPDSKYFPSNYVFCSACTDTGDIPHAAYLIRQDREYMCHDLDEYTAATMDTHILRFVCPTASEKWSFHNTILSYIFAGGEGSELFTSDISAFKKQTYVTTKDIGALQQYCKEEAKTFPKLDNKDMTWKGVVTLGRSLEAINDSLTTDVRFKHWLGNEVTRKELDEGNLITTMLSYMVTGSFAVYFKANIKVIRQTIVDFKSACIFLAQHCTTQRSVYAYDIHVSREIPEGKYQDLLSEFSIAAMITPILSQLYPNHVTVVKREDIPHKIFKHLSQSQRSYMQRRMEDGAAFKNGDRVHQGNITLDWIQAMCMQQETKAKPSQAKVMAIFETETALETMRSMASEAVSGQTTRLPDTIETELSGSEEEEEGETSEVVDSAAFNKMLHGYMRDPKKNKRFSTSPGNSSRKKPTRPLQKSPRFNALNTNPGVLKAFPSAERPCRICGSTEHWMAQCPRRHDQKFRDQNFNKSQSRVLRDIAKARAGRNFSEAQRLNTIFHSDNEEYLKICEDCDDREVTPYASETDNEDAKSVGISEVDEEEDDDDAMAPVTTGASGRS